jgi:amidase
MAELHDLTALEQGAAVRRREVSPVELVEHYLERIDRLDRPERAEVPLGAFITVAADLALEQARAAGRALDADGEAAPRGPLFGVPVPVKDLNPVAGVRTTFGSAVYTDFVPTAEDTVVTLLREAGTSMLGKTNAPEFGLPCYTENRVAPPARTPWDVTRSAGGSSGGAAAAVAAGLAPVAHGSDGGGSIRIPASVCGLVGLKPARGRITTGPLRGDVSGLGVDGTLARTVRDAAALLDVLAAPQLGDPHWAPPLPAGTSFLAAADVDPGRLRIARFCTPVIAAAAVHAECIEAYERASVLLESFGHDVVDVDPPFGPEVVPTFETVWATLATLTPVDPVREAELMPLTRWLRERGRSVSGTAYAQALAGMQLAARRAVVALAPYDAVLTPTLAQPPVPVGAFLDAGDGEADFEANKRFTPFTSVWNVTGLPAVSLPLHWTAEGLPVGVMLAGRPAGEAALISLAAQVESAAPWHARRPACW